MKSFCSPFRAILLTSAVAVAAVTVFTGANLAYVNAAQEVASIGDSDGARMRRLTPLQYERFVHDVFGGDIEIRGRFEPIPRVAGLLEVGAGQVALTAGGFRQYYAIAQGVAAQALDEAHRDILVPCTPANAKGADSFCAQQFVSKVGELIYRRPLFADESAKQIDLANKGATSLKDFYAGLTLSLESMLVQPQFLYRQEVVVPSKTKPGTFELDVFSKATRLSYFFWDSTPDRLLFEAARDGSLDTPAGLKRQVDRLIASPRVEDGIRAFFVDMLQFDQMELVAKDATIYPNFTREAANDSQEQTLRTISHHLVNENGDYRELFTTRKTFLTPMLGSVYQVPIIHDRPNGSPEKWAAYEYPEGDPRAGILTHASFVALHSHPGRTSPTNRGKAMREVILCQRVPPPPNNVNFTVLQDTSNPLHKTARDRLNAHATEAMCTGCHKITDPIGLALENFDSDGSYRLSENGAAIDTTGVVDGKAFNNALSLGQVVGQLPAASSCLVNRLTAYGLGREVGRTQAGWSKQLQQSFAQNGYRVTELMKTIAGSPEFFASVDTN
jgi:Protein of unknown function (DUF1592)/Protein of unknown function (DUF1588)/Protein of unknown function (DUF1595)/Protein of unknown function (DUF1585)